MNYSFENQEDLEQIKNLGKLEEQVKEVRLQMNYVKRIFNMMQRSF